MIITLSILFIILIPNQVVFADTSSSGGSQSGGGGSGSYNTTPIMWRVDTRPGNKNLVDPSRGKVFNTSGAIAYLIFHAANVSNEAVAEKGWFKWSSNPSCAGFETVNHIWNLSSPLPKEFIDQSPGYIDMKVSGKSGYAFKKGNEWLEAVSFQLWTQIQPDLDSAYSIRKVVREDGTIVYNDSRTNAASIFSSPITSASGTYTSKKFEYSFNHTYTVYYTQAIRTINMESDGKTTRVVSITYSKSNVGSTINGKKQYDAVIPDLTYKYFTPIDLRSQRIMNKTKFLNIFGDVETNDTPLQISVNNNQNNVPKTDDALKSVPASDENIASPFKLTFNNANLGIPTLAQGGYFLEDTQRNYSDDIAENGNELQLYWGANYNMYSDNNRIEKSMDTSSLKIIGEKEEYEGLSTIIKPRGWIGGNIEFKSILSNNYFIGYDNKPFGIDTLHTGKYYRYGLKYGWNTTLNPNSGVGSFNTFDIQKNIYNDFKQMTVEQPVLFAPFTSVSAGGFSN